MMEYHEKNVHLRRKMSLEDWTKEDDWPDLWVLSPVWPGRSKAKVSAGQLQDFISQCHHNSTRNAHLVLWMPSSELHRTPFNPIDMAGFWLPKAVIVSGSNPLQIGYVYAKGYSPVKWHTKLVLDDRKKRGMSSSKTVRLMLDELLDTKGFVADPFAHDSACLPIWCRRLGLQYTGSVTSKKSYRSMVKLLAQVELPGIQLSMPT